MPAFFVSARRITGIPIRGCQTKPKLNKMQRVMLIDQPGAGKSRLAQKIGDITGLPVIHIDLIHWKPGWVERTGPEKDVLCAEVHAQDRWIFEGGRSSTWPVRYRRCDTLIWLDYPLRTRLWRVLLRTLKNWGRSRPDLPPDCPERLSWTFFSYILRTRHSSRALMQKYHDMAMAEKPAYRLHSDRLVDEFLITLRQKNHRGAADEHGTVPG